MVSLFFIWVFVGNGARKADQKTCQWHVFPPWESPAHRKVCNKTRVDTLWYPCFLFGHLWVMGLERPTERMRGK